MVGYVKNFIAASVLYLALASIMGVEMLAAPNHIYMLKFPHSHLMLLGWVSMMIYGVGYHILPKFVGQMQVKSPKAAELQFWLSNLGLVGMVVFYIMDYLNPGGIFRMLTVGAGILEAVSMFMFFANLIATLYAKAE